MIPALMGNIVEHFSGQGPVNINEKQGFFTCVRSFVTFGLKRLASFVRRNGCRFFDYSHNQPK